MTTGRPPRGHRRPHRCLGRRWQRCSPRRSVDNNLDHATGCRTVVLSTESEAYRNRSVAISAQRHPTVDNARNGRPIGVIPASGTRDLSG
uniref:Uncharacterized protein n=1 Tax=Mycolicibacterium chubuense (strain NBB4) TaxID=710421 RepID=E7BQU9_MYCCN|nr:hypothetical protein [Mycolicibacterium chubuense NBB4]